MAIAVSNVSSTRALTLKSADAGATSATAKSSKLEGVEAPAADKDFKKVLSHARSPKPATRKGAPADAPADAPTPSEDAKKSSESKKSNEDAEAESVQAIDEDQPDADEIIAEKPDARDDLVTPAGQVLDPTDTLSQVKPTDAGGAKSDKPLVTALDAGPAPASDPGEQSDVPKTDAPASATGNTPVQATELEPVETPEPASPKHNPEHADEAPASPSLFDAQPAAPTQKAQGHEANAVSSLPVAPEARFAEENIPKVVTGVTGQLLPNGGTMHIRLDPPEMGALTVSIRIDRGTVEATFQTSTDQATQLLGHSLSQLKTALESAGVSVDKLNVTQIPADKQTSNNNPQNQQNSPQSQEEARQFQQEQQRKQMLQRMWRKLAGSDDLDMVA